MNTTELLALFRSQVRDESAPYLWSNIDIFSYMDTAQTEFVRHMGGIQDSTSAITTVTLDAEEEFTAVSEKILKLRGAWLSETGTPLTLYNFEQLEDGAAAVVSDYGSFLPTATLSLVTGTVFGLVTGMQQDMVRPVRIPVEDTEIRLVVDRLPLTALTTTGQSLEINSEHHVHLILGMKAQAFLKDDSETYDRGRADRNKADFEAYCEKALGERRKREHRYRGVVYGGY